jgi:enoyl-CoA hydratase/carnithine racemase
VPARIGYARAAEMALLGERVPARRALDWGLITRVLPDEGFEAGVDELVGKLAAGPTRSYAASKHALNAWLYRGMEDQLELEAVHQQRLAASPDFAEGVTAFLEKRPPAFRGE